MDSFTYSACGVGGCLDVAVENETLYCISNASQYLCSDGAGGCLRIFNLPKEGKPIQVGIVEHLGNARQLIVHDGYAYVASREDGLWVIDARDICHPRVAMHYDPVEFATGLAMEGSYLFVACRSFGVEVLDCSKPDRPEHVAILRTGEAQSLVVQDGFAYSGVWGRQEVVIHDVRDLGNPIECTRVPLQGRGDGVFIDGNLLYAVSGQHAWTEEHKTVKKHDEPGYGVGWGLEIFDVTDKNHPVSLSRLNLGICCYYPAYDMWSVTVVNNTAFCTFTHLGSYVIDVSDPKSPKIIRRYNFRIGKKHPSWMDMLEPKRCSYREVTLPYDAAKEIESPATNLAVTDGKVYISTGYTDLYEVADPLAKPVGKRQPKIVPKRSAFLPSTESWYRPHEQVHSVIKDGDTVYAACGNGGLHILHDDHGRLTLQKVVPTKGILRDVKKVGDYLLLCEFTEGFRIVKADTFEEVSCYHDGRYRNVDEVEVSPDSRFVLLHIGFNTLRFLDITDIEHPVPVLDGEGVRCTYCRQLMHGTYQGKYMAGHGNASYVHWFDVSGEKPVQMQWQQLPVGCPNNLVVYGDHIITTRKGGYTVFKPEETDDYSNSVQVFMDGRKLEGKPQLSKDGKTMFVSDRMSGPIWIIDISQINAPKVLLYEQTLGSPDIMAIEDEYVIWSLGYEGIRIVPIRYS